VARRCLLGVAALTLLFASPSAAKEPIVARISPPSPDLEAGDVWTPTITVRRGRATISRARVTLQVGTVTTRAASLGRGRYRARIQLS